MLVKVETPIYDFYHRVIGFIETDTRTGNKVAMDFYHRTLGFYEADLDATSDFYHRRIAHGDVTASLVMQEASKNN